MVVFASFKLSATGIHYPNSAIDNFNKLNASPDYKTNLIILLEVSNAVGRPLLRW
jgi:hypothetical protein